MLHSSNIVLLSWIPWIFIIFQQYCWWIWENSFLLRNYFESKRTLHSTKWKTSVYINKLFIFPNLFIYATYNQNTTGLSALLKGVTSERQKQQKPRVSISYWACWVVLFCLVRLFGTTIRVSSISSCL